MRRRRGVVAGTLGLFATLLLVDVAGASGPGLAKELVKPPAGWTVANSATAVSAEGPLRAGLEKSLPGVTSTVFGAWVGQSGTLAVVVASARRAIPVTLPASIASVVCDSETEASPVTVGPIAAMPGEQAFCSSNMALDITIRPASKTVAIVDCSSTAGQTVADLSALVDGIALEQYDLLAASDDHVSTVAAPSAALHHARFKGLIAFVALLVLAALVALVVLRRRRSRREATLSSSRSLGPSLASSGLWGGSAEPASRSTAEQLATTTWPHQVGLWGASPGSSPGPAIQVEPGLAPSPASPSPVPAPLVVGWQEVPGQPLMRCYWDGARWAETIRWDMATNAWMRAG